MIQRRAPLIRRRANKGKHTSKRRKSRASLAKQCAVLWADWIKREGRCEFIGKFVGNRQHLVCSGGLQAMHGFGKKAYPAVRYATWNGFCGCGAVHTFYTWHPELWCEELRQRWGEETYLRRLREANELRKYDLSAVAATYRMALTGVES